MKIIGDGGHATVCRECFTHGEGTFIAVGDNAARFREVLKAQGPFATLIAIGSFVSRTATIGEGTIIMAGAIVAAGARIGKHCIVNHGASVDHHCVIEDYAHIAPGAHLCGGVHVGEGALVGVGVGIEPGVTIPAWSIVKRERYTICPMK